MNALHKVAWTELIVSFTALSTALLLSPWLGDQAAGAFGILGLLGICPLFFLFNKKNEVVSDERDREIGLRSKSFGFATAWMFLSLLILGVAMWHDWSGQAIPTNYAVFLVFIGFALCYSAKAAYALVCYRNEQSAA